MAVQIYANEAANYPEKIQTDLDALKVQLFNRDFRLRAMSLEEDVRVYESARASIAHFVTHPEQVRHRNTFVITGDLPFFAEETAIFLKNFFWGREMNYREIEFINRIPIPLVPA